MRMAKSFSRLIYLSNMVFIIDFLYKLTDQELNHHHKDILVLRKRIARLEQLSRDTNLQMFRMQKRKKIFATQPIGELG